MQKKLLSNLLIAFYLIQLFLTPVSHYLFEISDNGECLASHVEVNFNTACNEHGGPCKNPTHHHKKSHNHSECVICKTVLQDIVYINQTREELPLHSDFVNDHTYVTINFLLSASFSSRSPPKRLS